MKRLLLILAAMLLLTACAKPETPDPTASTPTEPVSAGQPNLYVPQSALEQQTGGAVRVYDLKSNGWFGISGLGSGVLLTGANEMQLLTGEQGTLFAKSAVEFFTASSEMDVTATGVGYYVPDSRTVIVLNPQLQVATRRELPETVVGTPVINLLRNEVYYIAGAEIRAMNLNTGISRLLRQQSGVLEISPVVYFDGKVLVCRIQETQEQARTEYISAETGQTLCEDDGISEMHTAGDGYFLRYKDGRVTQMLFGTRTGETNVFDAVGDVFPVLKMNGIMTCEETEAGISLSFYDLSTGKRTAQTQLSNVEKPLSVYCDGTYIWLLAEESAAQRLLRWDVAKSAVQDETLYTSPFYTPESPDTEGIKACQTLADTYAQQYGVKLHIWQDATATTGAYTVTPEYQVQTIRAMLEELQPVLALFPADFLYKTVEAGWIRINLVREIDGGKDVAHLWQGKDCHILISANANAGELFIRAVAYAIDSHVIGNSRDFDFDRWNPLNPPDFTYPNGKDVQVKPEYLMGDTRAFTDELAATYIHEDRCSIFYNAMLANNAEMFTSPILQAKLQRLCMGIREAYGLQKSENTYPWEQYLETSLAYVE